MYKFSVQYTRPRPTHSEESRCNSHMAQHHKGVFIAQCQFVSFYLEQNFFGRANNFFSTWLSLFKIPENKLLSCLQARYVGSTMIILKHQIKVGSFVLKVPKIKL